jgi:hypothetical protein
MRRQCKKCPWLVTTNPFDIPNGYDPELHAALACTIAKPGELGANPVRVFACHESKGGQEMPCVGWLHNQLNAGNNIRLRIAVTLGAVDPTYTLLGEQHERFEDTLP